MDNTFTHYVGLRFNRNNKAYFFGCANADLALNDPVVVETIRGLEIGYVTSSLVDIANYKSTLELKPIIRKATTEDLEALEENNKRAEVAMKFTAEEITKLSLDMRLISAEYTLDRTKVIITYVSDDRVDFRELLKSLASRLRCRIELRQIGPRDKAKIVGGIGICGLPLCCSTFLNEFDGISINKAKNQLLSLNIPKLSGQCGKLICCLNYEDEAYTDLKKQFPKIGDKFQKDGINYRVGAINVLSRVIKIESLDNVQFISLEDYKKFANIV